MYTAGRVKNCSTSKRYNAEWGFKRCAGDFRTKNFVCGEWVVLKYKVLVFTTWNEFKGLTELAMVLKSKMERETEAALV